MTDLLPTIYLAFIGIFVGFAGLIWSADRFVAGAAAFANNLGVSAMIIGLTIVSFGTSAPEILVSINASLANSGEIAIGNALGSNIANVGLVLAATALVARIPVQKHILVDELPVLLVVTLLAGVLLYDGTLSNIDGWVLLAALVPAMAYLLFRKKKDITPKEAQLEEDIPEMSTGKSILWFLIGLALLIISSKVLVWGAQTTAEFYKVSPLIIGLTVLAIGTSLPELAASITSALKGHHDIALGNIVGSNIFNLLAVMSIPGILTPLTMESAVFSRDYSFMLGLTLLVAFFAALPFCLNKLRSASKPNNTAIGRLAGCVFLIVYVVYFVVLQQTA